MTSRVHPSLASLRRETSPEIIFESVRKTNACLVDSFRITDFSIQTNHLHLMNEANGKDALAEGMHALASYLARPLNRVVGRHGKVFETRYHSRVLMTPREVKNALRYVINNARRHAANDHLFFHPDWIDPFSSGAWFDGWEQSVSQADVRSFRRDHTAIACPVATPQTWLRRVGWRRWGLLAFDEIPGGE